MLVRCVRSNWFCSFNSLFNGGKTTWAPVTGNTLFWQRCCLRWHLSVFMTLHFQFLFSYKCRKQLYTYLLLEEKPLLIAWHTSLCRWLLVWPELGANICSVNTALLKLHRDFPLCNWNLELTSLSRPSYLTCKPMYKKSGLCYEPWASLMVKKQGLHSSLAGSPAF